MILKSGEFIVFAPILVTVGLFTKACSDSFICYEISKPLESLFSAECQNKEVVVEASHTSEKRLSSSIYSIITFMRLRGKVDNDYSVLKYVKLATTGISQFKIDA